MTNDTSLTRIETDNALTCPRWMKHAIMASYTAALMFVLIALVPALSWYHAAAVAIAVPIIPFKVWGLATRQYGPDPLDWLAEAVIGGVVIPFAVWHTTHDADVAIGALFLWLAAYLAFYRFES